MNFNEYEYDFPSLCLAYPSLKRWLHKSGRRLKDWKNVDAMRDLTCALLQRDFSLRLEIPRDKLIPAIPSRLDYILLIRDLLTYYPPPSETETFLRSTPSNIRANNPIYGIDLGCGASCIYPLLGCAVSSASPSSSSSWEKYSNRKSTLTNSLSDGLDAPYIVNEGVEPSDAASQGRKKKRKRDNHQSQPEQKQLAQNHERPWNFLALDIDGDSLEWAQQNVEINGLGGRIAVCKNVGTSTASSSNEPGEDKKLKPSNTLIRKEVLQEGIFYHFLMCNPPFYESQGQIDLQRRAKLLPPHSTCTGSEGEMITKGGEVYFLKCLVKTSLRLRKRIGWFTCLIGRKADVEEVEAYLTTLAMDKLQEGENDEWLEHRVDDSRCGVTSRWILSWRWRG